MKIVNSTGNTIYVEDIDLHIPYKNKEVEDIPPDLLKKSRCLRNFILNNMLEVVEYDKNERIEASIMFHKKQMQPDIISPPEEIEPPQVEPLITCESPIEVKLHGIFFDASGYGKVNRNLALKLKDAGLKVKIDPKRGTNQLNEDELRVIVALQNTEISRNHILIDSVIPTFGEMSSGKYKILYTTVESYTVPKQLLDCCSPYDEVWATSCWSADILKKYLPNKPIYPVVTGADEQLYTESGPKFDLKPNVKDFVFISVFGWNYRKGYDVLLKAYFDEFSEKDNVTLLIVSRYQSGQSKYHKNKIKSDIEQIMRGFANKDLPHVVRYSQVIREADMPKLYRACNAFVLCTRGESGCLPPIEASLCGLPVIMSNCSGQQGYLRPDNAYLLEIDHLEVARPGTFGLHYWDGQEFPAFTSEMSHTSTRKLLRQVYENYGEAKQRNKRLQKMILENFTWNNMANQSIIRLKEIWGKLKW